MGNEEKTNCWQFMKCGREPGGEKVEALGVCPAAEMEKADRIHGGINGGRACWAVAGTLCGGETQGSFVSKFGACNKCDFYQKVISEELIIKDNVDILFQIGYKVKR